MCLPTLVAHNINTIERDSSITECQCCIVSAARSLTCRDDLDSKWRLLLTENELLRVSLLSNFYRKFIIVLIMDFKV